MSYAIIEATPESKMGYQGYGAALDFWCSKEPEILLEGAYQCVAGETLIYDPVSGTEKPIVDLAREERPVTVLTMFGPRVAAPPFRKGIAKLYRVTTNDGRLFTGTAGHRVLTDRGWVSVSLLLPGVHLLVSAPAPLVSISALAPQELPLSARGLSQTLPSCQDDYSACCHPCDGLLRSVQGSGQVPAPLQVGVHEHSCGGRGWGDLVALQGHTRQNQLCVHPSSGDDFPLPANAAAKGYYAPRQTYEPTCASCQGASRFPLKSRLRLSTGVSHLHGQNKRYARCLVPCRPFLSLDAQYQQGSSIRSLSFLCLECAGKLQQFADTSLLHQQAYEGLQSHKDSALALFNCRVHTSTVSNVEYVRTDEYYDMHVPGAEHYYAQGFWHHNTGKTTAALHKLHTLLAKYPNCRALMVRRSYASLKGSAVVTYEQKVLPYPPEHPKCPVVKVGGGQPSEYHYPNGSVLVLGGLDNPNKFLSAEYDFIYINQMEEIRLDDYEKLVGRATGRAGNAPYPQIMGDCNPDVPTHWILNRPRLNRFRSRHEDNPTLFDPVTGAITELGRHSLAALDAMTGVRYKRGRLGLWVGAEGQVYEEWDNGVHVVDRFAIPPSWRRIRVIDFGYNNPTCVQWWAIDGDGRMYRYRELYMTGRTVARHKVDICIHSLGETYEATIADHDAEDRASLAEWTTVTDPALVERLTLGALAAWQKTKQKNVTDDDSVRWALEWAGFTRDRAGNVTLPGIQTKAADKRVKVGIERVQTRLKTAGDGKPRLFLMLDSLIEEDPMLKETYRPTCTEQEFPGYVWLQPGDGRPAREEPVKADDHGLDALRYGVQYVDGGATTQGVTFGSITKTSRW